jgi:hypothetical protein
MSTPRVAIIVALLLLVPLLCCCGEGEFLAGHPGARTILPADKAEGTYVLPDGREILFSMPDGLMMLDAATGAETVISKEIASAVWLGDDLLYGQAATQRFVVNLRPLKVVKLEALPAESPDLPTRLREADAIYVEAATTGLNDYNLLLLNRDPDGSVGGGYFVGEVRNMEVLLAGLPYQLRPDNPYYLSGGSADGTQKTMERLPSLDGQYYYKCGENGVAPLLQIYAQDGTPLNSIAVPNGDFDLQCQGWAWDNSGVYFQEGESAVGSLFKPRPRNGPLELLPVRP